MPYEWSPPGLKGHLSICRNTWDMCSSLPSIWNGEDGYTEKMPSRIILLVKIENVSFFEQGVPKRGGGGSTIWENFPNNTVIFSWTAPFYGPPMHDGL